MATTFGQKGLAESGTTLLAGAVVTAYRFVKYGADDSHCIPATAASVNVGVAWDNQDTVDRAVPVMYKPGSNVQVEAGAAFALGVKLTSNAAGQAVLATTGQPVSAIARQAATGINDLVVVELVNSNTTLAP